MKNESQAGYRGFERQQATHAIVLSGNWKGLHQINSDHPITPSSTALASIKSLHFSISYFFLLGIFIIVLLAVPSLGSQAMQLSVSSVVVVVFFRSGHLFVTFVAMSLIPFFGHRYPNFILFHFK